MAPVPGAAVLKVTYSWRVGLFVTGKLLAVVKAHQAPNMLELISESDTLQDLLKKLIGLRSTKC